VHSVVAYYMIVALLKKVDNDRCWQDVEGQLKSIMSEKLGLQLSVERAESELTEQKRLTESLQLVSSFFYSHPCIMLLYVHPNTDA